MYKLIKSLAPLVLLCFVVVFVVPIKAEAFWPFPDKAKANDNEHVQYNVSFKGDYFNDIRAGEKISMYLSVNYDGTPVTNLTIKDPKGFQLINYYSWNDEFVLKAPQDGGEYIILMEGEANKQKFTFSVPISVRDKGYMNPFGIILGVVVVSALVLGLAGMASSKKM